MSSVLVYLGRCYVCLSGDKEDLSLPVRGQENDISFAHNLLEHLTSNLSPLHSTITGIPKVPESRNPNEQIKRKQEAHPSRLGIQSTSSIC